MTTTTTLYDNVWTQYPFGPGLVAIINAVEPIDVGRFRDCWVERGEDELTPYWIHLLCRHGAGFEESQRSAADTIRRHSWFMRQEPDLIDEAYVHYFFKPARLKMSRDLDHVLMSMSRDPINHRIYWETYGL